MEWHEIFRGVEGQVPAAVVEEEQRERVGLLRRLRGNLGKAREALRGPLATIVLGGASEEVWERVEEALIAADVGVEATLEIVDELERRAAVRGLRSRDDLIAELAAAIAEELRPEDADTQRIDIAARPAVILVVGVNGTGKTTTIAKLAWRLKQMGKTPLMVAADTFRAAAAEQLSEWAARVGCDVVRQESGGDPAAVVYDGLAAATSRGADVVIIDTAGRLHTQVNLMRELEKVRRVVEKQLPGAPHETLLVLDATTGQNGLRQAQEFKQAVAVSGVVLTKLDGTAKGGIVVAIHKELGIPVKLIGIGERMEDLRPFDADEFTRALFSLGDEEVRA
jgi:fused signal recognition particle receptor